MGQSGESSASDRSHHRPMFKSAAFFDHLESGPDPARVSEAAERSATALVRGARGGDPALVERVLHLAENEGMEAIAELWSGAPAESLAGSLWRLFLLHTWVRSDPARAAREFEAGRLAHPVGEVIAGVADPPGPEQVVGMLDEVLGGAGTTDYADALFRAAAFARVVAAGRAGSSYDDDVSASRLITLSRQLEHAGRLELDGSL